MNDRVKEYLAAGKRIEDAATPGPWEQWVEHDSIHAFVNENTRRSITHGDEDGRTMTISIRAEDYDVPDSGVYDMDDALAEEYAQNDRSFVADARTRLPRYRRAIEIAREEYECDCSHCVDVWARIGRVLLGEESA